jgi:hypothetical protein
MKKALISTIEPREHFDGSKGYRVAQVESIGNEFPVAKDLYWLDCEDDVVADLFYFDTTTNSILPVPVFVPELQPQPKTIGTQTI